MQAPTLRDYPDGRSVVTGYEIIQKERAESEEEFSFEQAVEELLWPGEKDKKVDSSGERA